MYVRRTTSCVNEGVSGSTCGSSERESLINQCRQVQKKTVVNALGENNISRSGHSEAHSSVKNNLNGSAGMVRVGHVTEDKEDKAKWLTI